MTACIHLGRAETGSGALDWFDVPITELSEWVEVINDIEKDRKRRERKR